MARPGPFKFREGEAVILVRHPGENEWVRHGRELTIGKQYTIFLLSGWNGSQYDPQNCYTIKNDRGCLVTIEEQFFDAVEKTS